MLAYSHCVVWPFVCSAVMVDSWVLVLRDSPILASVLDQQTSSKHDLVHFVHSRLVQANDLHHTVSLWLDVELEATAGLIIETGVFLFEDGKANADV